MKGKITEIAFKAIITVIILVTSISNFTSLAGNPSDIRRPVNLNSCLSNEKSDEPALYGLDEKVLLFMQNWELKGLSLSIMKNDSLVYAKGYGWADEEKKVKMQASNIMRVASVSKLITATGIMLLQEEGLLSLKDKVFGEEGILKDEVYSSAIKDSNYYSITIEDLLRHKAGFTSKGGDPMFSTRAIIVREKLNRPPDLLTLIKNSLKKDLDYIPGTSQAYSNFGYLLLSRIIEEVSGESYEAFIKRKLLEPIGCIDFHIAGNYYKDRLKNEVRYYTAPNDKKVPEYTNSGRRVSRCYGGNDIHNLSGAGAWVASTPELALFVASINGRSEIPDIIRKESLDAMIEYFDKDTFSLGWNDTNPETGWIRTGTFSGTSALIKYFPDGECWILLTNTSTCKGAAFSRYTSALFDELREEYSKKIPRRNFFYGE